MLYDDPPDPLGDHRGRSVAADLHLLSPGSLAGGSRGADAPPGRRSDRARDRPCLPRAGGRHGERITRAKVKIKAAHVPYRVPSAEDLPARVSGVLAVLFLVFNEGYLATGPDTDPIRHDLTAEAIRLTRMIRALLPEDGEVAGLLALMLLTEARRAARVSANGELVPLGEQDRGAWDAALVAEGHRLVRERLASGVAPGRYQILAAINAVHTSARAARDTDWSQVVALYDQLVRLDPSPIVALNRAVAVAELDGPEVASGDRRPARGEVGRLSRLPCDPRRSPAPAGPPSEGARGVRPSHRAGGQHRRDRLPDSPPRPAGVATRREWATRRPLNPVASSHDCGVCSDLRRSAARRRGNGRRHRRARDGGCRRGSRRPVERAAAAAGPGRPDGGARHEPPLRRLVVGRPDDDRVRRGQRPVAPGGQLRLRRRGHDTARPQGLTRPRRRCRSNGSPNRPARAGPTRARRPRAGASGHRSEPSRRSAARTSSARSSVCRDGRTSPVAPPTARRSSSPRATSEPSPRTTSSSFGSSTRNGRRPSSSTCSPEPRDPVDGAANAGRPAGGGSCADRALRARGGLGCCSGGCPDHRRARRTGRGRARLAADPAHGARVAARPGQRLAQPAALRHSTSA